MAEWNKAVDDWLSANPNARYSDIQTAARSVGGDYDPSTGSFSFNNESYRPDYLQNRYIKGDQGYENVASGAVSNSTPTNGQFYNPNVSMSYTDNMLRAPVGGNVPIDPDHSNIVEQGYRTLPQENLDLGMVTNSKGDAGWYGQNESPLTREYLLANRRGSGPTNYTPMSQAQADNYMELGPTSSFAQGLGGRSDVADSSYIYGQQLPENWFPTDRANIPDYLKKALNIDDILKQNRDSVVRLPDGSYLSLDPAIHPQYPTEKGGLMPALVMGGLGMLSSGMLAGAFPALGTSLFSAGPLNLTGADLLSSAATQRYK